MERLVSRAMDIGEQMLLSGAEVHRVEDSIERMCAAFGAVRTDVFTITSNMTVTVFTEDGKYFTQERRIKTAGTDYERIHRLNDLSRHIAAGGMTEEEIEREYEKAVNCKRYPLWLECVCYAAIAAAFTLFFGGGIIESAVSLFIGAALRPCLLFAEKTITNKIFPKFFGSAVVSALAMLALSFGLIPDVDKVIIGNIMTLIPGIGLTNALRDLFTGDSIAGVLRSIEALLTALAIAAGYFAVALIRGLFL